MSALEALRERVQALAWRYPQQGAGHDIEVMNLTELQGLHAHLTRLKESTL